MESSSECMSIDVALMTLGRGSRSSGVILGSYQVQEGRRRELNMKWQGRPWDPGWD